MSLSEDLAWRGLIKDKTFNDTKWLDEPRTFYHGVDASSDSMTIGNLAAMLLARRLIDAGWKAVLLAGGATSLIGDPKDTEERELKPREEVQKNVAAIKEQINKLFAGKDFALVDNYDWFADVKYLDFLRDIGKNFAVSELMQREFVNQRMDSGISYAEFSYSLIQGYDYLQLFKNHSTVLQIGGSDQWGNMLSGVSLIRKKESQEVQALSMPLVVNKATGVKFGKSEEGAIWLDPAKTTPEQFYQFWINTDDADVEDYLKVFTLLGQDEIEQIMKLQSEDPAKRMAQVRLADAVTILVHGQEGLNIAQEHRSRITGSADPSNGEHIKLATGISVVDALVKTGLADSNSEARRLLEDKGVYVNNQPYDKETLEAGDFEDGKLLLRKGKKLQNSALVELE